MPQKLTEQAVLLCDKGAMFNGVENAGVGGAGNYIKLRRTASNVEEYINDAEGSWKQSTPDGNYDLMDGSGNRTMNIPDNLTMNIGGNFMVNVGKNMTFNVADTALFDVFKQMLVNTPQLRQLITEYYHTQAGKALINSENEIKIEAKETNVAGTQKLFMHSNETATINSKGMVHVKGEEGTNQVNKAADYEETRPEITAKCIVHFRPKKDWKGIGYGFDYMRKGDTYIFNGTPESGDVDYETIVSKQYTDTTYTTLVVDPNEEGKSFRKDIAMYNNLKKEYNIHNIPWKAKVDANCIELKDSNGNIIPEEYFCSWLSITSTTMKESAPIPIDSSMAAPTPQKIITNTKALLSLIVDIEE